MKRFAMEKLAVLPAIVVEAPAIGQQEVTMPDDPKDKRKESAPQTEETATGIKQPVCTCGQDPFAALPPELRPRLAPKKGGLRKITCRGCGLSYWTNRTTDLCIDCEKKGVQPPEAGTTSPG